MFGRVLNKILNSPDGALEILLGSDQNTPNNITVRWSQTWKLCYFFFDDHFTELTTEYETPLTEIFRLTDKIDIHKLHDYFDSVD